MKITKQRWEVLEEALEALVEERRKIENKITATVQAARKEGTTWRNIGISLGTSQQAAWERYGLTDAQKSERSRLNNSALAQDALPGMEPPREERVAARKLTLKQKRANGA
jgi:DNA-binding protein H-NS